MRLPSWARRDSRACSFEAVGIGADSGMCAEVCAVAAIGGIIPFRRLDAGGRQSFEGRSMLVLDLSLIPLAVGETRGNRGADVVIPITATTAGEA